MWVSDLIQQYVGEEETDLILSTLLVLFHLERHPRSWTPRR
jgi:hypothetical protein